MGSNKIINILIIGVWSSLIFEIGLSYFIDNLGVTLFNIFTALLFIVFTFSLLTKKIRLEIKVNKVMKRIFLIYIIYWIVSAIGLLYTPEKLTAFKDVLSYMEYTVILFITIIYFNNVSYKENVFTIRVIGWLSFLTLLFLTLFTLSTGTALNSLSEKNRFSISPFDDYNVFVYSLILSVLLIFINRKSKEKEILKYSVLMLLIILVGVLSGSRRSITMYGPISLLIPFILLWLKGRYVSVLKIVIPLSIVIIIGFNLIANINIVAINNFFNLPMQAALDLEQRFDRGTSFVKNTEIDTSSRSGRWKDSTELIYKFNLKEVLIGKGTRSYFAEDVFIREGGGKDSPHNFLLSAFIEGGILKTTLIVLFIIIFILNIIYVNKIGDFWTSVFLIVAFSTWVLTTLISGLEFFYSKQFILILLVNYFAYMERSESLNEIKKSNAYSFE